jgi:hypothetical protein
MYCSNCGKEVSPGSKFCQQCGAPLAPTAPAPISPSPTLPPEQQVKEDKVVKGKAKVPQMLEFSWDGRVRSARELFRFLHDFLTKYNYEHVYHELKDTPGAIAGTATFWDSLVGKKDYKKRNWWLLGSGIILLVTGIIVFIKGFSAISITAEGFMVGIILFFLGLIFMQKSTTKLRKSISLHVEGETYRARAEKKGETSSEVFDVVSNCRVVFSGKVGTPFAQAAAKGKAAMPESMAYDVAKLSKKKSDWDALKSEFDSFVIDFQSLRPRVEIPAAIADNKQE